MPKKTIAIGLGTAVIVGVLAMAGFGSQAASNTFTVRGIVTKINTDTSKVYVSANYVVGNLKEELAGVNTEYSLNGAALYKWQNNKKNRVTITKSAQEGDEVVMYGTKKGDSYTARWMVVNDRAFTVIGKVKEHNKTLKQFQVAVTSSTYKNSVYAGKDIIVRYGSSATFTSDGNTVEADDIPAGNQRARFTGSISHSNWIVTKVENNY